jgi:ABC-type amino acid transport substrate-binding protein
MTVRSTLLLLGAAAVSSAAAVGIGHLDHSSPAAVLADVPGAADPRVTQANIKETVCRVGYTATVRPPVSYTGSLKLRLMKAHGYTDSPADWELDHEVALGSGGDPTSLANLWLQPIAQARRDDVLEVRVQKDICAGRLTLAAGQRQLVTYKHAHG